MRLVRALALGALWGALAQVVAWAGDQPPAASQPAGAMVQTCLASAADFSPVYPTAQFSSLDRDMSAVFRLGADESVKQLTATWIAVDVGEAAPPNYRIATSTLAVGEERDRRGVFRYSQPGRLPVGRYRVDILADDKPWRSAEFTVVAPRADVQLAKPADLIPLTAGRVWTYDLTLVGGPGAKVSLPGVTPDAQGRLRATFSMGVADADDTGAHLQTRVNGRLTAEEWWRVGETGLVALKRSVGDQRVVLDPPQVLVPWPLRGPQTWDYVPKDRTIKQTYRMWGPVPLKGPWGDSPGYVILIEDQVSLGAVAAKRTVERWFLPGVGFVREVLIMGLGGRLISRQETVLRSSEGGTAGEVTAPPGRPSGAD